MLILFISGTPSLLLLSIIILIVFTVKIRILPSSFFSFNVLFGIVNEWMNGYLLIFV